jgi:predicted metal-dependent HD superfamily phosphohydrolase
MINNRKIVTLSKIFIVTLLESLHDKWYYFHNLQHTLDVYHRVSYLAKKAKLDNKNIEILQLSALFHDTWFIFKYDNNEEFWAKIWERFLSYHKYPKKHIDIIKDVIMATVVWYKPKNILEKLIKDADLDNLWRNDFPYRLSVLREEIKNIKWVYFSDKEWFDIVYKFITWSRFYTITQKKEREDIRKRNIDIMLDRIEKINDWKFKI